MDTPKTHVFICTNGPDRDGKCGSKGAEKLRQAVKTQLSAEFAPGELRVNGAGCLGQCEQGIACVIYPQQNWTLNLKSEDSEFLVQKIKTFLK